MEIETCANNCELDGASPSYMTLTENGEPNIVILQFRPFHGLISFLLGFASMFGFFNVRGWFGRFGCFLLFMKGILGCLTSYSHCSVFINHLYHEIGLISTSLVIPFLCAEICFEGGLKLEMVYFHLIYPVLQIALDLFLDWPLELQLLDLSLALSILVMSTYTLSEHNYNGIILGCIFQTSLCFTKKLCTAAADILVASACLFLGPTLNGFTHPHIKLFKHV